MAWDKLMDILYTRNSAPKATQGYGVPPRIPRAPEFSKATLPKLKYFPNLSRTLAYLATHWRPGMSPTHPSVCAIVNKASVLPK